MLDPARSAGPSDRDRVKELLAEAAKLKAELRRGFIESSTDKPEIIAEALDLLPCADDPAFLNNPTGAGWADRDHTTFLEAPGMRIGRYKLLQKIGEGGFGIVFMAEQVEPVIRRVALKIIKAGMDTRQVIARFEAERQALAMMDHPNIARVLDAGATEQGRPYFVMELVRGEPVTGYCDREKLSIEDRLLLFRDVCGAVQHAHQKGIIHRDIKPTNVLVTVADGRPLPKVIDFGVAKATQFRLTEKTLFTEMHQLVGTPEYMSPEQAEVSGIDIDTRSDVYSLGVLLYELLAGGPPFDSKRLRSAPFAEIQRIIRDEEPPRPSMRLRTLAASSSNILLLPEKQGAKRGPDSSAIDIARRRRTEPVLLAKSLNGDLDLIVMKCLEKDRNRRYETASALAGDVTRYLAHQPVAASPPSATYRLRKMVQRHRGAFMAAAAMAAVLIASTAVATMFALREARALAAEQKQRQLAEKSAKETKQVASFQQTQLAGIDPELMGRRIRDAIIGDAKAGMERAGLSAEEIAGRQQQLEALLDDANPTNVALKSLDENIFERAQQAADEQFKDQPLVKADILQTLAATLMNLGLFDRAASIQKEALEIRQTTLGPDAEDTLVSLDGQGNVFLEQGKLNEAEKCFRDILAIKTNKGQSEDKDGLTAMNNLGLCLLMQGRREEGQACYRGLVEKYKKLDPDSVETQQALSNMGGMLMDAGQYAEAEPFFREAAEGSRRLFGPDHATTILSSNNLAILLEKQGKLEEAAKTYRDCLERSRRALGEDHHETLLYMSNLGFTLSSLGRQEEAESVTREALARRQKTMGPDHRDTLQSLHNLGVVLRAAGKLAESEKSVREALERRRRVFGENHLLTLQSLSYLGVVLRAEGKLNEAEPFYREALERRQRTLGRDHPETIESMNNLGILLIAQGKTPDAEPIFREVLGLPEEKLAADSPSRLTAQLGMARCMIAKEEFDAANGLIKGVEKAGIARPLGIGLHRQLISAYIAYYEARNKATPTPEFEQLAAQWRSKRDAEQKKGPTSVPAAVP